MIWQVYLHEGQADIEMDFRSQIYSNPTHEKIFGPESQIQTLNLFKTVTLHFLERKTNSPPLL